VPINSYDYCPPVLILYIITQFLDTIFHSITCFCLFVWQLVYLFTIDDLLISSIFCQVSSSCLYWSVCIHLSGWKGQLIYLMTYIWLNTHVSINYLIEFTVLRWTCSWFPFLPNLTEFCYCDYVFFNCYWYLIALHGVSIVNVNQATEDCVNISKYIWTSFSYNRTGF